MQDQFRETFDRFRNFISYSEPYSWEEWVNLKTSDMKLAALYCQFFNEITLAWYKAKADFVPTEDGVSCVLQYLFKNIEVIEKDKSRYSPSYIYRVAYNCMDCLRFVQRDINRSKYEMTNVIYHNDDELDLCDLFPHRDQDIDVMSTRDRFWAIITDMGIETEKVINHLLNGESLRRVSKRSKLYGIDPLTDVSVNPKQFEEIVDTLRIRLAGFKEVYY